MADNTKIVTDELVAQIAERLTAAGEKVTNRAIWSAIGGGSMTTISGALRRWRERQELQPEQRTERPAAPDEVREKALQMAEQMAEEIWLTSQGVTQQEIDDLSNTMNERISKANSERDVALGELQAALEELEGAKASIVEQTEAVAAAVANADRLTAELVDVKVRLAGQTDAARTAQAALNEAHERTNHLTSLLDKERLERTTAAERAVEAEQKVARLTAEEEAQRNRADDLAERLKRVEQRAELLDQRLEKAEGEAREAIRDAGNQRTAAETARAEAAEARHDSKEAHEVARIAQAAADELRKQLEALKARDAELAEKQQPNKG